MPSPLPAKSILINVHFRVIYNLVLCHLGVARGWGQYKNRQVNNVANFGTLLGER